MTILDSGSTSISSKKELILRVCGLAFIKLELHFLSSLRLLLPAFLLFDRFVLLLLLLAAAAPPTFMEFFYTLISTIFIWLFFSIIGDELPSFCSSFFFFVRSLGFSSIPVLLSIYLLWCSISCWLSSSLALYYGSRSSSSFSMLLMKRWICWCCFWRPNWIYRCLLIFFLALLRLSLN